MKFRLSHEQRQFAASLDDLLSESAVPGVVRRWRVGDHGPGRKLWQRLADLGVIGLLADGGDLVDVAVAFEQLGRHAVPGPLVESVAVAPLLLAGSELADRLPESMTSVSYGSALDADVADLVLVVDGDVLSTGHCEGLVMSSVDRARRLFSVTPDRVVGAARREAWDAGVLACAAQLLGAGCRVLDMAVGYAQQRVQFGRPIGGFQAVKHRLADAYVGLEFARPLVYGAALSGTPRDVSAAKVACADAAYRASRVALQVHGAVGYTDEHDLGLWLTKIRALVGAWGTGSVHRARVLEALCG
ncbi:MAG TPA: acyl-CoA dehydrogenase family protein [Pseudonocardiaceae bacterium]